jgi:hypothetical protein
MRCITGAFQPIASPASSLVPSGRVVLPVPGPGLWSEASRAYGSDSTSSSRQAVGICPSCVFGLRRSGATQSLRHALAIAACARSMRQDLATVIFFHTVRHLHERHDNLGSDGVLPLDSRWFYPPVCGARTSMARAVKSRRTNTPLRCPVAAGTSSRRSSPIPTASIPRPCPTSRRSAKALIAGRRLSAPRPQSLRPRIRA